MKKHHVYVAAFIIVELERRRRRSPGVRWTHVCGHGAGLGKDDGQVEERSREEQTRRADQRVGSGRPGPQPPAGLDAAGHAQDASDAGDGSENEAEGRETSMTPFLPGTRRDVGLSVTCPRRRTAPPRRGLASR